MTANHTNSDLAGNDSKSVHADRVRVDEHPLPPGSSDGIISPEALRGAAYVYDWIDYPDPAKEIEIVGLRAPDVVERTARAVVAAVGELREMPLAKPPGVAEAIDWAEAAQMLATSGTRWPLAFRRAIGTALKDEEDLRFVAERLDEVLERATA